MALLADLANLLRPEEVVQRKWLLKNNREGRVQVVRRPLLFRSYYKNQERIRHLPSYAAAEEALKGDQLSPERLRFAGQQATLQGMLPHIITCGLRVTGRTVRIDNAQALRSFRSYCAALASSEFRYEVRAPLLGVMPTVKLLALPDGVRLYRLTARERNERWHGSHPYIPQEVSTKLLSFHPAELRLPVSYPFDQFRRGVLSSVEDVAREESKAIFSKICDAIRVSLPGRVQLGRIELRAPIASKSGALSYFEGIPTSVNVTLGSKDLSNISTAYELMSSGAQADRVLRGALHRFLLGRQRDDLVDKLVDYVIAWEAVLLAKMNGEKGELTYRFSMNGAALLAAASRRRDPRPMYEKFRSAYGARSAIVHGSSDKDRDSELRRGGFKDFRQLCDFLESNFRRAVFWLAKFDQKDRPYHATGGWEDLIWRARR